MSRATIRDAIIDYFAPAGVSSITGVANIFRSWPRIVQPEQIIQAGAKAGAVAVVVLERDFEERVALGGATSGKKRITYQCRLDVKFRAVFDEDESGEKAMDAFDLVIDAIKAKLRTDRTLAAPSVVFQAGEEPLMEGEYGDPVLDGETIEIWGGVRFIVSEWITS